MSKIINEIIIEEENFPREIFSLSSEDQRDIFYYGKILKSGFVYKINDFDDKICYSQSQLNLRFNNKLYTQRKVDRGLTFDKTTKKLRVWFGGDISFFLKPNKFFLFLKQLNIDWVTEDLIPLIRKSSLERILAGKITNPIQLAKYYLRTSLKSKASPKLLIKLIKSGNCLSHFTNLQKVVKNEDNLLLKLINGFKPDKIYYDFTNELYTLGEKMDINWSYKRVIEEHRRTTERITYKKLKFEKDIDLKIQYDGILNLLPNTKLLDNKRDIFFEGTTQHHCLYSSYSGSIINKRYFAVAMYLPERCTIGIDIHTNEHKILRARLHQVHGINNSRVQDTTKELIKIWLEIPEVNDFFVKNYKEIELLKMVDVWV
jgi:hypothetical protein